MRHLRFDEAIESHRKAATALEETLQTCTSNTKIAESIKLQRDFQLKNIELVRLKKIQYEKYKLAVEQQRTKNAGFLEQRLAKDRTENVCDLQMSIFKTLQESDALLELLSSKHVLTDYDNETLTEGIRVSFVNEVKLKRTKSDHSIIEDMHTINHQLHILVFNLVSRIDEYSHERDRLKSIDKDRSHQRKTSLPINNKSSSDSSNKADDAMDISDLPERERRNSIEGEERKIILPESSDLPPLELPEFDYNF